MAIEGYMAFVRAAQGGAAGTAFGSESQVNWNDPSELGAHKDFIDMRAMAQGGNVFEIESWGFGVERVLSTGSQSTGIGTGSATFKEFTIERKIDQSSPLFFKMSVTGQTFAKVSLCLRKAVGDDYSGQTFLRYDFRVVGVKSIDWSHDEEAPKETLTFEYGALNVRYSPQDTGGGLGSEIQANFNRIANEVDPDPNKVIVRRAGGK